MEILLLLAVLAGFIGTILMVRGQMFDVYLTKEVFDVFEENREDFAWNDRFILWLGRQMFENKVDRFKNMDNSIRELKKGNEVILGFILLSLNFLLNLIVVMVEL